MSEATGSSNYIFLHIGVVFPQAQLLYLWDLCAELSALSLTSNKRESIMSAIFMMACLE